MPTSVVKGLNAASKPSASYPNPIDRCLKSLRGKNKSGMTILGALSSVQEAQEEVKTYGAVVGYVPASGAVREAVIIHDGNGRVHGFFYARCLGFLNNRIGC
jgi:hypothetical protein